MASRHVLRSLPGHVAIALSMLIGAVTAVSAVYSYFYEGWGQGATNAVAYLTPPLLVVTVCTAATRWPRTGGLICLAGGVVAGAWWLWKHAAAVGLEASVVQTAVVFFAPVLLTGALFLLEGRHQRLLAAERLRPTSPWWGRHYRLALVVGVPLFAVLIGPLRELPDMLARYDDGQRGMRTIEGNGVTLTWAPRGPGWNQLQPDGTYPSWNAIVSYGGSGAGVCGHLSEDGAALVATPVRAWRLPTANEVIRSLTRGGTNAGCTWDGRSTHAICGRPPDKETPLWAPDEPPIYYFTSDGAGEQYVLGVNYTGGITPHRRLTTGRGVGYRCVRDVR